MVHHVLYELHYRKRTIPKEERSMQSIAIDREYGSGGREVARILSAKLGIPV